MPTLADFIRAEKHEVDEGSWRTGHIERSAFPLSRSKSRHFRFGPEYRWRLVRFQCLGSRCRVLIQYNPGKLICRSTFAVEVDNDLVVLCSHEYHADHPGWHCHLARGEHLQLEPGVFRTGLKRWPAVDAPHSKRDFEVTEASALSHVAARYRFKAQGELL